MEAVALSMEQLRANPETALSLVVATNVPDFERGSGFLFRKGAILEETKRAEILPRLISLARSAPADFSLHLLGIEPGELGEDAAGSRLAELVAGPGLEKHSPVESRVNLVARRRGLLRIDVERLDRINEVPGVAVFTLYDGMAVEAGTEVAGAKVIPLVYPLGRLAEVAEIAGSRPIVDVVPFWPWRVGVVVREELKPKARARFQAAVEQKLAWFGAISLGIELAGDAAAIEKAMRGFKERDAQLILQVGGHSSDPLDPVFEVLSRLGVEMERHGAPAHPGTLFWLAYWGETVLFGLASCGMFSRTTLGDLFLARLLAGEHLTSRAIARMGHGGLFTHEMAFRFPPYGLKLEEN